MRGTCALLIVLATLLVVAPAHAQSAGGPYPYVPWVELLPPAPSSTAVQPGPRPHCEEATLACVDGVIERLKAFRDRFGCDHRAVFADTYMLLTEQIRNTIADEPGFFDDNAYLIYEDVVFAEFYSDMHAADARGEPIPEAWRIANDVAAGPNSNAAVDMLLGINAHVQRDMPYVVASVGLRFPDGGTRKPDHDRGNLVLAAAYERIVRDVQKRYDPLVSLTNASWSPIDDAGGLEVVKGWREGVWRNAERLLNAKTDAERAQVSQAIEQNAAAWARMIAAGQVQLGYGAQRDAYCRTRP
jgi:hypothetical protein